MISLSSEVGYGRRGIGFIEQLADGVTESANAVYKER